MNNRTAVESGSSVRLSSYKAIIFDLDNTLTETNSYPIRASRWFLTQLGITDESFLEQYLHVLITTYFMGVRNIAEGAPYRSPIDIVKSAMETATRATHLDPDPGLVTQTSRMFQQLHLEMSELQPNTRLLLARLEQRGIRMGVITNSFEGHLPLILRRLGVIDYFDALIDPGDVHAYKPMAAPFKEAMRRLGSTAEETLYIGDEYYADVVGAKGVGIDVVWVNSRRQSLEDNLQRYGESTHPDLVLNALHELLDYV